MDLAVVLASSSVIAAVVGALAGYLSQRSLADRRVRLDYEYNARKRLYEAIGPLQFQLLMACRDVVRRVAAQTRQGTWDMNPAHYYANNTMYRLLRPLAVCTLIDRQMNAADFSVDPHTVDLLRFEVGAYRMLTNKDPLEYHSGLDWGRETQHVFRDNLRRAATALIKADHDNRPYVMDYAEFLETFTDPVEEPSLHPLARIIAATRTSLMQNPVFWTRVVGYGYLCQDFIAVHGKDLGFTTRGVDVVVLLQGTDDAEIRANLDKQVEIFDKIIAEGL